MATSLPKFSRAAQKILVAQNLGGAAAPLAPPARTPMGTVILCLLRACDLSVVSLSY